MKMIYAYFKVKYNTWDTFELESKQGREAGKIRRVLAWFFISTGFAILFGAKGWNLSINGVRKGESE